MVLLAIEIICVLKEGETWCYLGAASSFCAPESAAYSLHSALEFRPGFTLPSYAYRFYFHRTKVKQTGNIMYIFISPTLEKT